MEVFGLVGVEGEGDRLLASAPRLPEEKRAPTSKG